MLANLRNPRILTAFLYDAIWSVLALYFSMCVRWGAVALEDFPVANLGQLFLMVSVSQIFCFMVSGLYLGIWRFSSTRDLIRIVQGVSSGVVFSFFLCFLVTRLDTVPRSLFILDWLILIVGLGAGRFAYRMLKDHSHLPRQLSHQSLTKVLIMGAGPAGERLLRDIRLNPSLGLQVIGFIDDDTFTLNRSIHGVKVLGNRQHLRELVEKHHVKRLFIAIPSVTGDQLGAILKLTEGLGLEIKTLPKFDDIVSGKIEVSLLRNLSLDDLLGRKPVNLDGDQIASMIRNRTVMVTGAGGSIGSELCRQIARYRPSRLVLFEICELFMYEMEMELQRTFPNLEIIPVMGDVRDAQRVDSVVEHYRPEIVFHAAAYKHVPMMEKNPAEAIRTNVFGTRTVALACDRFGVKKFVLISTDKAVNPTNVMGTTKRVAEMICEDLCSKGSATQFMIVRFGNVIGSNGSVIPLFKKQIERGGPVTVTHPDITRYFMSIPEASQLVLQAATMGFGGEIFVLDMGEPIKVIDLVERMLGLAGLERDKDIKVEFIGLRPGEKLYEELFQEGEKFSRTNHEKIFKARNRPVDPLFERHLEELVGCSKKDKDSTVSTLQQIVPEYVRVN